MRNQNLFNDKVVWLTGASSGIGKELSIQLAGLGAKLVLSSRKEPLLESLKNDLINHDEHMVLPMDLSAPDGFEALRNKVLDRYGCIDFLIQNGGISQRGTAADSSEEVIRKIMEVNFFGNVLLTKLVLPELRKSKGHILVISSIAGKFGFFLRSSYSASKHALHGYYESLALEEEDNGISVTIACPGKINTPISTNALEVDGQKHGQMDHNQETGMPVGVCVSQLLKALSKKKREVLIGNKEIKAVTLKRFLPALFWRIIKKQSAT
ncbi:MAG: SDR family oxidoreductase [Crocinitomicaceae bacterium]|tara:strand:- start:3285 stop:4085 length:801 start_codon:yes stop_codon:yes gene_type:complete